jgi:transcriptional regulator with XRE-family HTH domain
MPKTPRLREWRERATLSQEELKDRAGVSRATIADLEAGNRGAQPRTVRRLAAALGVEPTDLYGEEPRSPKEKAPPSQQPTLNGALEEERRLRYLRAWRAFIYGLARRWEEKPPQTPEEIDPTLGALAALLEQGVFDPSWREDPSEAIGLGLILDGLRRLAEIAEKVEGSDAAAREFMEKLSA